VVTPNGVTQYSYDPLGRVVCTAVRMNPAVYGSLPADACTPSQEGTAGPDRISRATYDAVGRVVQQESGVGTKLQQVTVRNTYSPGGQVLSLTDSNGNRSAYEYDGFGRLKRLTVKDLPGTTTEDVYLSYEEDGRHVIGRLGSPTAQLPWVYKLEHDQAGRLVADQHPLGGRTAIYDAEGHQTELRGYGGTVRYGYDYAGRLTSLDVGSYSVFTTIAHLHYGPLNRLSYVWRPNGIATSYHHDAGGRLASLAHTAPTQADGFLQNFEYNAASQVVGVSQPAQQYVWSGQPTTTTNFAHDQLNRDSATAAASGYDADGNLISDGVRTFTYDAENRLKSVTGGPTNVTLSYDPWGRLEVVTANGVPTRFQYFGSALTGEGGNSGNGGCCSLTRAYIHGPFADQPLAMDSNPHTTTPKLTYLHQDRLGSVVATSDAGGAVTPFTYGPYGEPQSWAGSRFRYTGQIAIPEAQLYHYKARVYDPMMGRFLQTDPIGYGDGPNMYAYVGGDPMNRTDPSGTHTWPMNGCGGPVGGMEVALAGDYCGSRALAGWAYLAGFSYDPTSYNYMNEVARFTALSSAATGLSYKAQCDAGVGTPYCFAHYQITEGQWELIRNGNVTGFWDSRDRAGDPMGEIGLDMGTNTGPLAKAANAWLDATYLAVHGKALDASTRAAIRVDLASAHAVWVSMDRAGTPGLLSAKQISEYHHEVFARYGLPEGTFGGTPLTGQYVPGSSQLWCPRCDSVSP
jgi:RHS repeat-associated protein